MYGGCGVVCVATGGSCGGRVSMVVSSGGRGREGSHCVVVLRRGGSGRCGECCRWSVVVVVVLLLPVRRLHLRSVAVPNVAVVAASASAGQPPPPPPDRRLHRRCKIFLNVTMVAASASTGPPLPPPLRPFMLFAAPPSAAASAPWCKLKVQYGICDMSSGYMRVASK